MLRKKAIKTNKTVIGWREWVSLGKLGIEMVKAKIDTGARSSALHAYDINTYIDRKGISKVKFKVYPLQKNNMVYVRCRAKIIDKRIVKSSSGQKELRIMIKTYLYIGTHKVPIEITLTNRDHMGFRLLLGRTAIKEKFLVDPKRSFLLTRREL